MTSGAADLPYERGASVAARRGRTLYHVAAGSLVAAIFLPLVVLFRQNLRRILLACLLLDSVFVIDVNFGFRRDTALVGAIEGFNLSLTTAALVGLYASWLFGFLARERSTPRRLRMNGPLALYLGFVALSMIGAQDFKLAQFQLFMLVQIFLVHVYVASALRTRADILFVVAVTLVGIVLEAPILMATVAMGHSFVIGGIEALFEPDTGRASGFFGSPIIAASYLALVLAPCASLVLARVSSGLKALAMLAFALGTLCLIFTQSRGAWISFGLSMTLVGLAAWRRGYISLRGPLLGAVVVMLLVLPFSGLIAERVGGDDHGSARARIPLAILASKVIEEHPWLWTRPQ